MGLLISIVIIILYCAHTKGNNYNSKLNNKSLNKYENICDFLVISSKFCANFV